MVWKEKGDGEFSWGGCNYAVDESESVDDGENVCLNLKVVLGDVDGNDGVRSL